MRINITSVLVHNQDQALQFYTEVLGFVKKTEIPLGQARWLTVVSPDDPDGCELLLEPDGHPAAKPFKEALVNDGIPYTSFAVEDVRAEFEPSVGVPSARLPPDALMRGTATRPGSVRPAPCGSARRFGWPAAAPTGGRRSGQL